MMIDWLCKAGKTPVLAVDADANSNLNEVLGVEVETTLGDIREIIAESDMDDNTPIPPSMSKKEYLDYKFNSALVEDDDFDLSDITTRPASREDIIAAAEEAAFKEDN